MYIHQFDLIIIGAGAAGLMCAQLSAKRGFKVAILDHSHKLAEKIRISGGGRCNFTNINAQNSCYISANPHFATSALARYTPYHFIELLDAHHISYHEKTLGQLFCDESSEVIIQLLDHLCQQQQVKRLMGVTIDNVSHANQNFQVSTTTHGQFQAPRLVIASGGLSIPQIGASGFGYQIARQFGLNIVETAPALVPLIMAPCDLSTFAALAGISCSSQVGLAGSKITFNENCLFTHRGLSGPAILQISSYWQGGASLVINLLPEHNLTSLLTHERRSNKLLSNFLANFFSKRLAASLVSLLGFDKPLSQLKNSQIEAISNLIHHFSLIPSGTAGYKKAEVTRGGVDTAELNSKTMMATKVTGLYFIGEVMDVTGWLGGYNFQWAWSSAYAAAMSF